MQVIWATSSLLAMIAIMWVAAGRMPLLTEKVLGDAGSRTATLDGFRGLLAISVLLHHCILIRQNFLTGSVFEPPGHFDNFLGGGAVGFFFMTSAFLFCGKLVRDHGQIDVKAFAAGRVRRIVPLYVAAVGAALIMTIWEAGWVVAVPVSRLIVNVGQWLLFDFVERPDLNGVRGSAIYLGVVWTLRFEWILYFLLPIFALVLRKTGTPWALLAGLLAFSLVTRIAAFFLVGTLSYFLMRLDSRFWRTAWSSAAVVGVAICLYLYGNFNGPKQAILLTPLFVVVLQGKSRLVGWLACKPMRYLGQISYSTYLLHILVIQIIAAHVVGQATFGRLTDPELFLFAIASFVVVIAVSTATFLFIERPFIAVGPARAKREMLVVQAQVP